MAFGGKRDHRVGGGEDRLGRAVVLLQRHDARQRIEALGKVEDVTHGRSAKGIDRLRVVADHRQAHAAGADRQHDLALQRVGVLVFVDEEMIETAGDLVGDRGLTEHLREPEQEVVVVEHVLALLRLDIGREERAQRLLVRGDPGEPLADRRPEIGAGVDGARIDGEARRLGREALRCLGQACFVAGPVHEIGRVFAVVDGELGIEADSERVFPQEAGADGVEGAGVIRHGGLRGLGCEAARDQPLDAADEFGRRPAGKGREHDPLRIGARKDERGDPVREHRRLAGARARDDEQRRRASGIADPMLDREPLLEIELDRGVLANQGDGH